jgi:transcriptional regulator with XRE-family HTH domain
MNPKIWRESQKLSLAAFGDRIGRTAPSVQRYERGERFPDPETIAAYVVATNGAVGYQDFIDVRAEKRQVPVPAVTAAMFRKKQTGTLAKGAKMSARSRAKMRVQARRAGA